MNVLLDTNVLIDVLANRKPFARTSAMIWSLADRGHFRAFASAISFSNIYYILRKSNGREKAASALREVQHICRTAAVDASVIDRASEAGFHDFEDAVQYFSAVEASADYLVTRDAKDFPDDGVIEIVSPEELLAILSTSEPSP